jgi:hypothetical protein
MSERNIFLLTSAKHEVILKNQLVRQTSTVSSVVIEARNSEIVGKGVGCKEGYGDGREVCGIGDGTAVGSAVTTRITDISCVAVSWSTTSVGWT